MDCFKYKSSPHRHLPVHEHGQQPVAQGGEFLGLELEDLDLFEYRGCDGGVGFQGFGDGDDQRGFIDGSLVDVRLLSAGTQDHVTRDLSHNERIDIAVFDGVCLPDAEDGLVGGGLDGEDGGADVTDDG